MVLASPRPVVATAPHGERVTVPRCMSTQHPDNVSVPFFAQGPVLRGEDEVREAYYAFSHLGCDEQMWDFEGKEVDEFVVEKLLTSYDTFFRQSPLGRDVFLTPRVPNPSLEPAQAKGLLEVLHSLPRHSDVARMFYGREQVPIFEVIFPMCTSATELERVRSYYVDGVRALGADREMRDWFGKFEPSDVGVIPLIEEREAVLRAHEIVREYARGKSLPYVRVFIGRSDPALNYGMFATVLLTLIALRRLEALEPELGLPLYPILGAGTSPFRGNLRPDRVEGVLARHPSVQTFTIQSAFKYDYPPAQVVAATRQLRETPRGAALEVDEGRALPLIERLAARYEAEVKTIAPLVRAVAGHIPKRRMRKLHVGLFGYSRSMNGTQLPRAITYCASLYSIGLPPEVLGFSALDDDEWRWLADTIPCLEPDLRDAVRYLDPEVVQRVPPSVAESISRAFDRIKVEAVDREHTQFARRIRAGEGDADLMADLVLRAAALRRFLG